MQRTTHFTHLDKAIIRVIAAYLDHRSTVRFSKTNHFIHRALCDDSDNGAVINPSFQFANCLATRHLEAAEAMLAAANEEARMTLLNRIVHISDLPTRVLKMSALYFVVSWAKDSITRNMIMKYVTPEQIKPYLDENTGTVVAPGTHQKAVFSISRLTKALSDYNNDLNPDDEALTADLFQQVIEAIGSLPAHYRHELARQDEPLIKNNELRKFDNALLPMVHVTTDGDSINPFNNPAFGKEYAFVRTRGRCVKITKSEAMKYSKTTYHAKAGPTLFGVFADAVRKLDETRSKRATDFVTDICASAKPTPA